MNRAWRRAQDARSRRKMAELGCNCRPQLIPVDPEDMLEGASYGVVVAHQRGCRFGDAVLGLNAVGITPSVIDQGPVPRPCKRTNGGRR